MILAAGFGKRLRPLTDILPKPLLEVGGRPLIDYGLLLLKKYGITEVWINLHHHGDRIVQAVGDGSRLGMRIQYSEEPEILGTGGGIKKMAADLGAESFIVLNGDIVVEVDLDQVLAFHRDKKAAATLVLRQAEDPAQYGVIEIDRTDRIRNILDRTPWEGKEKRRLMFTGVHILEPRVLDYIPSGRFYSIVDAYIEMLRNKNNLYGYLNEGYWNDLGEIDRYQWVNREIKAGKLKLSHVP
ncbi:MAG: NDP-sugar synthase [Nitrospiria bacterium]